MRTERFLIDIGGSFGSDVSAQLAYDKARKAFADANGRDPGRHHPIVVMLESDKLTEIFRGIWSRFADDLRDGKINVRITSPDPQPRKRRTSNRFAVVCMECEKRFKTASMIPSCPRCGGSDIDVA